MVKIDPMETKSFHAKIYIEPSLAKVIKDYQDRMGMYSFSEAGRQLLIDGLTMDGR